MATFFLPTFNPEKLLNVECYMLTLYLVNLKNVIFTGLDTLRKSPVYLYA